jgi:hypothetical protein
MTTLTVYKFKQYDINTDSWEHCKEDFMATMEYTTKVAKSEVIKSSSLEIDSSTLDQLGRYWLDRAKSLQANQPFRA